MRRGDVVWVDLDPGRGSGSNRRRPGVVVSNDGANSTARALGRGVVTIVPVTSNTQRVYPFQVRLPEGCCGLSRDSKAQAEQIRSVDVVRIGAVIGHLTPRLLDELDDAIRLHLGV
jgi:mRNA interferase MazF